jgi:hypothetical protein
MGLFDARLRPTALAEEERRRRRRAAAAAVPLAELAAQLRRVRAALEHSTGIAADPLACGRGGGSSLGPSIGQDILLSRLQPYQKAQLRRLSRLEAEVEALRREPGSREAAARRLLQQELQALSADVMPAGGEWPGFEQSLARAAEASERSAIERAVAERGVAERGVAERAVAPVEERLTDEAAGGVVEASGSKAEGGGRHAGRASDVCSHSFPSVLSRVEARCGGGAGSGGQGAASGVDVAGGGAACSGACDRRVACDSSGSSDAEMTHEQLAASLRAQTAALEARLAQAEGTLALAFGAATPQADGDSKDGTCGIGGSGRQGLAADSSLNLDAGHPPWSPPPASVSAFLSGAAHAPCAAPHAAPSRSFPPFRHNTTPPAPPAAGQGRCVPGATGLSQRERGEVLAALSVLDAICSEHDALHTKWVSGGHMGSGGQVQSFSSGASCVAALTQQSRAQAASLVHSAAEQGGAAGNLAVVGTAGRAHAAPDGGVRLRGWASATPRHITLAPRVERSLWRDQADFERRVRAGGVKEPWRLIERLASDLLEEAIDQTAAELVAAADETVETLCREEFGAA